MKTKKNNLNPKHQDILKTIDQINVKTGNKIEFGHNDLKKRWKMKQEKLSKCYSTKINDVIVLNCKERSKLDREFLDSL